MRLICAGVGRGRKIGGFPHKYGSYGEGTRQPEHCAKKILSTKGFSTISLIRITGMALLCDRVGDTPHTNREKIEISQVFMELLGFKVVVRAGECLGYLNCC